MILKLEFCEPCSTRLTIFRSLHGAEGAARAVIMSMKECEICSRQSALDKIQTVPLSPSARPGKG